eukprot:Plantae.Rhodophyta-Hildenbrandia_rubra.ctg18655.p1 GENE.Plantae.Rhodophyta-Hildenbrandia_rubra.ctg18655~~Plantae.Rhodophyta-Hildenbrandia_rubra.ctg18655.p1  ORF type:complete len:522 (-),score=80.14 Plantae.Rhodophyta-Hildenbrandia_rubra.ctg18655:723-2288(-)
MSLEAVSAGTYLDGAGGLNATSVSENLFGIGQQVGANIEAMNVMFVLFSGYLVFFMQTGFGMLTAGSVRSKNTKNVLIKNVFDACVGAIAYFLFGWAWAYGTGISAAPGFIATGNYALSSVNGEPFTDFVNFFFQWAFAATAATIVSGSVAERTSFYAYLGYAFFLTSFVYPVVSHWVWDANVNVGWLNNLGVIDFAGCTVVHMVGGFAGLAGAIIVGPRIGRFDSEGRVQPLPGHSATLCTLGTFILWFGWYGFNPGSALSISGARSVLFNDGEDLTVNDAGEAIASGFAVAQRCAVTTTLAAAAGGITTLIIIKIRDHIFDLLACLNGILAGLVGITASCAFVDPWAAIVIGTIAAIVYMGAAMLLLKLKIDDPLEAFPIHGAGGVWGTLAVGLFNTRNNQIIAGLQGDHFGAFFGGGGRLLGVNLAAVCVIAAWTLVMITPFFIIMKLLGLLRISEEEEIAGNDVSKHGGTAYPEDPIHMAEKEAFTKIDNLGMDESLKNGRHHVEDPAVATRPAETV